MANNSTIVNMYVCVYVSYLEVGQEGTALEEVDHKHDPGVGRERAAAGVVDLPLLGPVSAYTFKTSKHQNISTSIYRESRTPIITHSHR